VIARVGITTVQPAAQGAVRDGDASRRATDAAVARDSFCEELGQGRGRDDDPALYRGLPPLRAAGARLPDGMDGGEPTTEDSVVRVAR
jgi:hypothetical protein